MDKEQKKKPKKEHGNEKPLKINVSFGKAMGKIVGPKPKKKPSK